jgi:hypothetical protein
MRSFFLHSYGNPVAGRRLVVGLGLLLVLLAARNVSALPEIIAPPVSVYAASGDLAQFSVKVTQLATNGPVPLSVQWRRNGQNIPGALDVFTNSSGQVYAYLSITNAQASDSGMYYAMAYDADGAVNSTDAFLYITNLQTVAAGDNFADRVALAAWGGSLASDNTGATQEPGEPNPGGVKGGSSVWFKWTAPSSGVAYFDTRGSDFDTTFGIYTIGTKGTESVTNLVTVAGDDDAGQYFNSAVAFNAASGTEYEIAVDGFYGVQGDIVLNWSLEQTSDQVPQILTQPQSVTVKSNGAASLFIVATNNNSYPLQYQWYYNGVPISQQATQSLFAISSVTPQNVGEYRVLVSLLYQQNSNRTTLSWPAQVQLDYQNKTNVQAQAKFREATDSSSGLTPRAVPVSGFTGTHIWSTFGAESEPGEPDHCGKAGGAPYWFSYLAAADGTLTVDAYTPTFTNVLAIYTGPGDSYDTLVSAACASTNQGVGHEVAVFPAANGTTYWIVVDGLNAGVGNVTLSYNLTAPPVFTTQPQSQTVPLGSNVTLTASAAGIPSPWYQWRTNALKFLSRTNSSLTLTNFQATNQWNYDVVATNLVGAATSSVAALYLDSPLRFTNTARTVTNSFTALLLGKANTNYIVQASTNLATTNWIPILTNSPPFGIMSFVDTNVSGYSNRFFRAVVKTN